MLQSIDVQGCLCFVDLESFGEFLKVEVRLSSRAKGTNWSREEREERERKEEREERGRKGGWRRCSMYVLCANVLIYHCSLCSEHNANWKAKMAHYCPPPPDSG